MLHSKYIFVLGEAGDKSYLETIQPEHPLIVAWAKRHNPKTHTEWIAPTIPSVWDVAESRNPSSPEDILHDDSNSHRPRPARSLKVTFFEISKGRSWVRDLERHHRGPCVGRCTLRPPF